METTLHMSSVEVSDDSSIALLSLRYRRRYIRHLLKLKNDFMDALLAGCLWALLSSRCLVPSRQHCAGAVSGVWLEHQTRDRLSGQTHHLARKNFLQLLRGAQLRPCASEHQRLCGPIGDMWRKAGGLASRLVQSLSHVDWESVGDASLPSQMSTDFS